MDDGILISMWGSRWNSRLLAWPAPTQVVAAIQSELENGRSLSPFSLFVTLPFKYIHNQELNILHFEEVLSSQGHRHPIACLLYTE